MSETQTMPDERWGGDTAGPFGGQVAQAGSVAQAMPMSVATSIGGANSASDLAMAGVITAQRVAVKRNMAEIRREAMVEAQAAGDLFFYRIPFKNRRKGTTEWVEGPTIQCAMAAANIYGNCRVEAFVQAETPEAFIFLARFTDLEKGVTITRSFRQRRSMDTGMGDNERRLEMVFSIGQSKAMRNVTVAALGWLTDLMESEAKNGILAKIEHNPNAAKTKLHSIITAMEIPMARVERSVGRKINDWLAPDMARLFGQLASVRDGFASPDDLFPDPDAALMDERQDAQGATAVAGVKAKPAQAEAADKPAPRQRKQAAPPPAEEKKPDREPEPPAQQETLAQGAAEMTQPEPEDEAHLPTDDERDAEEQQAEEDEIPAGPAAKPQEGLTFG